MEPNIHVLYNTYNITAALPADTQLITHMTRDSNSTQLPGQSPHTPNQSQTNIAIVPPPTE